MFLCCSHMCMLKIINQLSGAPRQCFKRERKVNVFCAKKFFSKKIKENRWKNFNFQHTHASARRENAYLINFSTFVRRMIGNNKMNSSKVQKTSKEKPLRIILKKPLSGSFELWI